MSLEENENRRVAATNTFVKTAIVPQSYNQAPPAPVAEGIVDHSGTIEGQWIIGSSVINESIPQTKGLIGVWPQRGLNSIYRFGFIPINTASTVAAGNHAELRGLLSGTTSPAGNTAPLDDFGNLGQLYYYQELIVPYQNSLPGASQNTIQVSPATTNNIAFARKYAERISVDANAVGIGTTTLTGTFTAASIDDTRGIAQDPTNGAYSIAALQQTATTPKDYVGPRTCDRGVTVIQGNHVSANFSNPFQDNCTQEYCTWTQFSGIGPGEVDINTQSVTDSVGTSAPWTLYYTLEAMSYWVTPWQIGAQTRSKWPTSTTYTIQMPPIGETDALRIRLRVPCGVVKNANIGATSAYADVYNHVLQATHVFATCLPNGSVQYYTAVELVNLRSGNGSDQFVDGAYFDPASNPSPWPTGNFYHRANGGYVYGKTVELRPIEFRTSYTQQGKYLGTYLSFTVAGSASGANSFSSSGNVAWLCYANPFFSIAPEMDNRQGDCGPARIIRYDNLQPNMSVTVEGTYWAQIRPLATLAPYLKGAAMAKSNWCDADALRLLEALLNGHGPFKRVWDTREYRAFAETVIRVLTPEMLQKFASEDDGIQAMMHQTDLMRLLERAAQAARTETAGTRRPRPFEIQ